MNITLSVDEEVVIAARKVAASMGKSLNQIIREDLERLTQIQDRKNALENFKKLTGLGDSKGKKIDRDELYERT